jgi:hypothetical protein
LVLSSAGGAKPVRAPDQQAAYLAVDELLNVLISLGKLGVLLLGVALLLFIANKWWQRKRAGCGLRD